MSSNREEPILRRREAEGACLPDRQALAPAGAVGYWALSRSPATSILFILPLLVVYEAGIWRSEGTSGGRPPAATSAWRGEVSEGDKNAIAAVTKGPLFIFGRRAMLAFNVIVAAALAGALVYLVRRGSLRWQVFPLMVVESAVYALGLMLVVNSVLHWQLAAPEAPGAFGHLWEKSVAAAGAGVYEELLFRGVILGALYFIALNVLRMKRWAAFVASMVAASAVFSLAHLMSVGELTDWVAFRFRFAAGMMLSAVFLLRGLGIAAWAHAIYNVWAFCVPG